MHSLSNEELKEKCKVVRKHIIEIITCAGSGHPGGSLSSVEILVSLYFNIMKHKPNEPKWEERDRFILSKGHGVPALYAVMAETGYFSKELLPSLRKLGSPLQGHPDKRMLPILEASTGSLGQGLSIGIGMALGLKLNKISSYVYVLLGDGECDEGQIWEASMFAGHRKLDNIIAIVDYNKIQLDGWVKDILDLEPFADKWKAFGWNVYEIDGHDISQILETVKKAKNTKAKPTVIITHTIKGKGVSFMENNVKYHGTASNKEECEKALKELA